VLDPLDIVDGIELPALLAKRTGGLMQPQMKPAIEKATRKQFPQGIAAFGTDALRLAFASLATQSRDLRFDMARVEGYRNFCNKLWNGARYVLMNVDGKDNSPAGIELSLADRWIRSRLSETLNRVERGFASYRLDMVATALYEFTWHEFCDWYLELTKAVLQAPLASEAQQRGTRATLIECLEALLRALHPLAPFISEEIWQRVAPAGRASAETIMRAPFPEAAQFAADAQSEAEMRWVMDFILGVRQIRGEMDIAPARKIDVLLAHASATDVALATRHAAYLGRLAGVQSKTLDPNEPRPISAVATLGDMEILVPMAGLIDPTAELERVAKRRTKLQIDLGKLESKMTNSDFVANAPPDVIAKDTARIAELRTELRQLDAQHHRVTALRAASG
jgi:valyl-tRNA synthetase